MGGDLLFGPALGREHGHGELRGGQVIRHVVSRIRIMDAPPEDGPARAPAASCSCSPSPPPDADK